jgi:phosphatidate cytidylyltransferase
MSNLIKKWLVGIPIGILFLIFIYLGGLYYQFLTVIVAIIAAIEWYLLSSALSKRIKAIGYIYLLLSAIAFISLRQEVGFLPIFWLGLTVIATDIGGQYGGRFFGRKFFKNGLSKISPNKTWEGLISGIILAGIVGVGFTLFTKAFWWCVIISAILTIVAQIGDLLESWAKRKSGIKDSSNILGAHGGILDRIDGHIAVNLIIGIIYFIFGWKWIIPF